MLRDRFSSSWDPWGRRQLSGLYPRPEGQRQPQLLEPLRLLGKDGVALTMRSKGPSSGIYGTQNPIAREPRLSIATRI